MKIGFWWILLIPLPSVVVFWYQLSSRNIRWTRRDWAIKIDCLSCDPACNGKGLCHSYLKERKGYISFAGFLKPASFCCRQAVFALQPV